MAVVPMQKINLWLHKEDKAKALVFLQSKGVLHLTEVSSGHEALKPMGADETGHELEMEVAQLDFAVNFLVQYEVPKKGLQAKIDGPSVKAHINEVEDTVKSFKYKDVVARCQSVEEQLVNLHNEQKALEADKEKLFPWRYLTCALDSPRETRNVASLFVTLALKDWEEFKTELVAISPLIVLECDNIVDIRVYVHIICDLTVVPDINSLIGTYKAERVELPEAKGSVTDELDRIDKRLKEIHDRQAQLKEAAQELSKDLPKLRMAYDFVNWKHLQKKARRKFLATDSAVLISGWMPKEGVPKIREELLKITKNFELLDVEPDEGESAPVLLKHRRFLQPFRSVTDVYGLPLYHEADPTPYLAVFFIVYFGMCLTDAGYGLIMFAATWAILKYLKIPKSIENLVRLLMYGGLLTFIMGILFGGWFGMTPDQAPGFMTAVRGEKLMFIGQVFDPLGNALSVLILSLSLGFIQVLFGVWLNFFHNFRHIGKKDALLDNLPWAYLLTVIGLFILLKAGLLPEILASAITPLLYAGIISLVLTQGRKKSNIIAKFFSGLLSLYNLVGYMSDVLSYSRLLALGLATTIIGMAVNTIASLANGIPYVGIIFAIIILIGGHIFNLGINALGSFIHSGRLQFVEFFGKFLEGGGAPFRPFARESKFVHLKK
ncbi:V-type ATP synthase subunit I [Candidatus Peregrinibacteria bacterium]|nr:V-type ATP synthase subunit I [Candidatus Peregrinibacteria bacterium]